MQSYNVCLKDETAERELGWQFRNKKGRGQLLKLRVENIEERCRDNSMPYILHGNKSEVVNTV
jgi:hypothetical protein